MAQLRIRHFPKTDEFCLSHSETIELSEKLSEVELNEIQVNRELCEILSGDVELRKKDCGELVASTCARLRSILENLLCSIGSDFANMVTSGGFHLLGVEDLE